MASLRKEFAVAIGAGESAIRIDTDELDDATKTISEVCKKHQWELRIFDVLAGLRWLEGEPSKIIEEPKSKSVLRGMSETDQIIDAMTNKFGGGDKAQATQIVQALQDFWKEAPQPDEAVHGQVRPIVLLIKNFHLGFEGGRREGMSAVIQHLVGDKIMNHKDYDKLKKDQYDPHGIDGDSDTGKFLIGMMPAEAKLPAEVNPLFKRISHELPDEDELGTILDGVLPAADSDDEDDTGSGLSAEDRHKVCKFALGLTRLQAEGVFGACIVMHKRIVPSYVWQAKSDILNSEGLVTLYTGTEKFKDIVGLTGAKTMMTKLLAPNEFYESNPDLRAKGMLFCGAPGVGKSATAKAAGNELGLPTLMVNPGNWMGSYIGESEAKTRKGFQILQKHAPCIAVVDEVEKVMPKSRSGGGDSGVGARMEGTFLTNMNDLKEQIFWVFTANDVKNMHEAFFRAERVDAVFYVKLPDPEQRSALWKLYGKKTFPKEMQVGKEMKAFPQYRSISFDEVLEDLQKAKKPNRAAWAAKFVLPMMCRPPAERPELLARVQAVHEEIAATIKLVDDDGWSPAEIKACCRLACMLDQSLSETQDMIRPVSISAKRVIEGLEEWAAESALDAETGKLYQPDPVMRDDSNEEDETDSRKVRQSTKVRRKVRRVE